jgi:hypothetical protein
MAGPGKKPVQVYRTGLLLHGVKFTFETGFELPSSWRTLPAYGAHLNRSGLDLRRLLFRSPPLYSNLVRFERKDHNLDSGYSKESP